ncbi:MAG TPA: cbb3-type cytochrome c oxidase subunit I [Chitinophagaceae bacterium]|nr:cbb3-type cytochrome c oxidase subunit I [Chitinophagaceae bacterium]
MESKHSSFLVFLMKPKNWWLPFAVIFTISIAGVSFIGYETYHKAPPIPDFTDEKGNIVIGKEDIIAGQQVFHHYALMEYGSMFGDGALRGPDFTAQALDQASQYEKEFYVAQQKASQHLLFEDGISEHVKKEIKQNNYYEKTNQVKLTAAQVYATKQLFQFYSEVFTNPQFSQSFHPSGYIKNTGEIRVLADFFYWGAWVSAAARPGKNYSYTHNWPYQPAAGNTPTGAIIIWSVIGILGLIIGLGWVLYYYGQFENLSEEYYSKGSSEMVSEKKLLAYKPTAAQRATFKFFLVAAVLFLIQVLAGILTVHDFVGLTKFFGFDVQKILPVTISRSWHIQLSLFWISACWIAGSFFILPFLTRGYEAPHQVKWINSLFWVFGVMVAGSFIGIFAGPQNMLGNFSRWLGHQGWEFVDFGRLWQYLLMVIFAMWAIIIYRGVKPVLRFRQPWALPNWLVYAVVAVLVLLTSGFVATPRTNFVIADFWRWCVIHMWVEAFFEVFTTIIVGYLMVLMGLVNRQAVTRVVYIGALLFLGSGLLGISHNFYWNAKPVGTLAIGSVFSTLQVVPLILLTIEAWRFKKMPEYLQAKSNGNTSSAFAMQAVFLFLVGVNFWNFLGAGVFGLIINLPIVNYYEHGTYLTVNHGHAALMGVYGNLSLAVLLFCCRYLIRPFKWNDKIVRVMFWSFNIGLLLMVMMDLLPTGIYQFSAVVDHGLAFARSQDFIEGTTFQTFTWLRILGGMIFLFGGLVPLVWFIVSRASQLRQKENLKMAVMQNEAVAVG